MEERDVGIDIGIAIALVVGEVGALAVGTDADVAVT
jgi:hypothetical protein